MTTGRKRSRLYYTRRITLALIVLIVLVAVFWEQLPYQRFAEGQIREILGQYGITVSSVTVDHLNQNEAKISALTLGGDEHPLTAGDIVATYDWQALQDGKVRTLQIESLNVDAYETKDGWSIGGLEPLMQADEAAAPTSPSLLFDAAALRDLLPAQLSLPDVTLNANGVSLEGTSHFSFTLESLAANATFDKAGVTMGELGAVTESASLSTQLDEATGRWAGNLSAPIVTVTGTPMPLPPMLADINFEADAKTISATIHVQDEANEMRADFSLNMPTNTPGKGKLVAEELRFPWGGGVISARKTTLPLDGASPVKLKINIDEVALAALLELVSDQRITGSGTLKGSIPLTWSPDGSLTLHDGEISAPGEGRLEVSPDLLPAGSQENIALVRSALENFHYNLLKITVSSDADGKPRILLAVQGNNPDTLNGRPIKLNVNLTGDLLPVLQQSILPSQDIKQLLKRETP